MIGWDRLSARVEPMADPDDRRWDEPYDDALSACDQRLLRWAATGILYWWGGHVVVTADTAGPMPSESPVLPGADPARAHLFIRSGLLENEYIEGDVTRIGITEAGRHALVDGRAPLTAQSWWHGYGPILTLALLLIVAGFILAVLV